MSDTEKRLFSLSDRLARLEDLVNREAVKVSVQEVEKVKLEISVKDKEELTTILSMVVELFKQMGGSHERELLIKLEQFVNYGLSIVFGENNKFLAEFRSEGKDVHVDFLIESNMARCDVVEAKGGGLAEVVSILLQFFFVIVVRGKIAPIFVMDTALVNLSDAYCEKASELLKELCDKLDLQLIFLTHSKDFGKFADKLYEFSQEDGKTIVRCVK